MFFGPKGPETARFRGHGEPSEVALHCIPAAKFAVFSFGPSSHRTIVRLGIRLPENHGTIR